jgi:hypothetical protein
LEIVIAAVAIDDPAPRISIRRDRAIIIAAIREEIVSTRHERAATKDRRRRARRDRSENPNADPHALFYSPTSRIVSCADFGSVSVRTTHERRALSIWVR